LVLRGISKYFLDCLKDGCFSNLLSKVKEDKDLDLQIRENYINIYYKGNSLLKLEERGEGGFKVDIHEKFKGALNIPKNLTNETQTLDFLRSLPVLKENIIEHGKSSLEIEYEQLIIRANNLEPKNNSEYYIVDRQYATSNRSRFDLTGIYWPSEGRKRGQEVPLSFMEVKFALNSDIRNISNQIATYYDYIQKNSEDISSEAETVFKQKLELNLFNQKDRLDALKTLKISSDVNTYQFIVVLVDYNPNSTLFEIEKLRELPFSKQIKVFYSGFAIWQQFLVDI